MSRIILRIKVLTPQPGPSTHLCKNQTKHLLNICDTSRSFTYEHKISFLRVVEISANNRVETQVKETQMTCSRSFQESLAELKFEARFPGLECGDSGTVLPLPLLDNVPKGIPSSYSALTHASKAQAAK